MAYVVDLGGVHVGARDGDQLPVELAVVNHLLISVGRRRRVSIVQGRLSV